MLDQLPTELLNDIAHLLPGEDLLHLRLTCRSLSSKSAAAFARVHRKEVKVTMNREGLCPEPLVQLEWLAASDPTRYAVHQLELSCAEDWNPAPPDNSDSEASLDSEDWAGDMLTRFSMEEEPEQPLTPLRWPRDDGGHLDLGRLPADFDRLHACLQRLPNCRSFSPVHGEFNEDLFDILLALLSRPGVHATTLWWRGEYTKDSLGAGLLASPVFRANWAQLRVLTLQFPRQLEEMHTNAPLLQLLTLAKSLREFSLFVPDYRAEALFAGLGGMSTPPPLEILKLDDIDNTSDASLAAFLRLLAPTLHELIITRMFLRTGSWAVVLGSLTSTPYPQLSSVLLYKLRDLSSPEAGWITDCRVFFCPLRVDNVPGHGPFELVAENYGYEPQLPPHLAGLPGVDVRDHKDDPAVFPWFVNGARFRGRPAGVRLALVATARAAYTRGPGADEYPAPPPLAPHWNVQRKDFDPFEH